MGPYVAIVSSQVDQRVPDMKRKSKIILGIETSCDETSLAVLEVSDGKKVNFHHHDIYSQVEYHSEFGGVVPELAARKHVETLPVMLQKLLKKRDFLFENLDAIAVTVGPGLVTSLMVGIDTAKTIGLLKNIPVVPVHHLKGHILATELPDARVGGINTIQFPALALVVSGGHTELVLMKNHTSFERVGQTIDDAVGEAYDKVAKLMGISYPGGPILDKISKNGNPEKYNFPRPMSRHNTLDFSYSGLKTAVRIQLSKGEKFKKEDIAASFQQAVVESLVLKLKKGIEKYQPSSILLGGGVANNSELRNAFKIVSRGMKVPAFISPKRYTMDNAAMIAWVGYRTLDKAVQKSKFYLINANPNLPYDHT